MHNIRAFFNADLNIIRKDITVVTARVQATKDSIHSITQQTSTNELLATNKVMQIRIDTLDDARRRKNLKIRGTSKSIAASASRDVLVRFLTLQDKLATQEAVKNKIPLQFETMQLQFMQDLCRSTLDWRRAFQPVTNSLQTTNIPYKWGQSRTFTATRDGRTYQLLTAEDSSAFHTYSLLLTGGTFNSL
ncbi:Hypothetical predicted protein [Pelobates cultripes]|uniref:Uncharacterized protein n=1 Tax=Pelobates cultripes TaxID=61616 RepID=A0AAD1S8D8_PELCU|nr:Hypothetical predicted protein [Pelobates cultripes]